MKAVWLSKLRIVRALVVYCFVRLEGSAWFVWFVFPVCMVPSIEIPLDLNGFGSV